MLWKLLTSSVLLMIFTLWPSAAQAQDDTVGATEAVTQTGTLTQTETLTQTLTTAPPRVEYTFTPSMQPAPELYPDPELSPASADSEDSHMQGWYPHPRYVNGSCAWMAQQEGEGVLISIDAICLSPSHRALFRTVSLTATDRTGRPLGGTLMTYRKNVSVGVYPITQSPFTLTVDVNEVFDRIGIYFRRPTVFDNVEISY
jgi:hypothetical protein